jgi:hypothetical protein
MVGIAGILLHEVYFLRAAFRRRRLHEGIANIGFGVVIAEGDGLINQALCASVRNAHILDAVQP